jgi:predicted ATPase
MRRLEEGMRRPWVKHRREHQLVLERRARRSLHRLERLQEIGHETAKNNDMETRGHRDALPLGRFLVDG